MSLRRSTVILDTLDKMPAPAIRHLTILQCGKLALNISRKNADQHQQEASCGAEDAATNILQQLGEPTEMFRYQVKDGRSLDGVRLKRTLFRPIRGISMTPWQCAVYRAGLHTAEILMRRLSDSDLIYAKL